MARLALNVKKILIGLCFILFPLTLYAQDRSIGKLISDQIISPVLLEVRKASNANTEKRKQCQSIHFSIKFIINARSLTCDTVLFSKSISGKLTLKSEVFRDLKVDWARILSKGQDCKSDSTYEVLLPIRLTRSNGSPCKLSEYQLWEIYSDLIMMDKGDFAQLLILSPLTISMSNPYKKVD
jgi:hypothetical protein